MYSISRFEAIISKGTIILAFCKKEMSFKVKLKKEHKLRKLYCDYRYKNNFQDFFGNKSDDEDFEKNTTD